MSSANRDETTSPLAPRGRSERKEMIHRQHTILLPLGRCGLGILAAAVAVSCSAGEGSSALQPANASAAQVSRTASGSGGAASKPVSGVASTPAGTTTTSEQRPQAAFDPPAFAPTPDAG